MAYKYALKLGDFEIIMEVETFEEIDELRRRFARDNNEVDCWISWKGGDCPVADGTKTEVKFRSGSVDVDSNPECLYWKHDGEYCDIIAYRVLED